MYLTADNINKFKGTISIRISLDQSHVSTENYFDFRF